MSNKKLLIRIISLIISISVLHILASKFYWYTSIWWLDMPMHFLGGLWLGLFFIFISFKKEFNRKLIFEILLGVLLVGICWEIFEILTLKYPFNFLDNISDVLLDLAGGTFSIFYFLKKTIFKEENKI